MSRFNGTELCAFLVLAILGTLLIMGRDSTLTQAFCAIAGVVFTKGVGSEAWRAVRRARLKGSLSMEGEKDAESATKKATPP